MSDDEREVVQNFESVWDFEARLFSLGDIPTPPKGIRQTTVLYLVGGMFALFIAQSIGALSGVFSLLPWWAWLTLVGISTAVFSVVEIQGLRAHQIIPALGRHLVAAKTLHGWVACAPLGRRWRMSDLPLIPDGSEPEFTGMLYTGPGMFLRTRQASRTTAGEAGRRRRGAVDLTLTELPGPPLEQPKVTRVPAGRTVAIRPLER